ncbi:7alpha-cephem-methoxylase P8 chain [Teratosphaeria destructans]|uniref:7alpha-cephem-methoxylase P8 chain n=1 Tax=Teratosphaeria destructans TaxID=418781 RepID=A0A9W7SNT6_9PEZI|nr:7alpha-cephem-methoxylase P8 chain [Teratosphaeria destructans]
MSTTTQTQAPTKLNTTTDIPIPRGETTSKLVFYAPPADGSAPWNYVEPEPGQQQRNYGEDEHEVTIHDIRGREHDFDINTNGFGVVQDVKSEEKDFTDDESIKKLYYPEVERLLLDHVPGANRIFIFDHTVRRSGPGARRAPVNRAHIDQTTKSAVARVHYHMGDEAPALLQHRVRLINVWRPLNGPVVASPLAFADSRTVPEADVVGVEHRYPHRTGETAGVRFTEGGRWYYWSGMRNEERVLLQCFDSADGARTPHIATGASAIDLKTPATYPIRVGKSILKPAQAKRYVSLRYNHKDRPQSSDATCQLVWDGREKGRSELRVRVQEQEAGEDAAYLYDGEDVGFRSSYVLLVTGQGKDAELVLERLSGSHHLNLYRTPTDHDEERVRGRHEQIRLASHADEDDLFGDDGEEAPLDPSNPFDYRHFLKAAEEKTKRSETEPKPKTAGTPQPSSQQTARSTPAVKPKKRPEAPLYVPPTKRKAPASADKPSAKRAKATQDPSTTTPSAPKRPPKTTPQAPPPQIRVDRKASLRRTSTHHDDDDDDDGELILENDTSAHPPRQAAMSLALAGHLATTNGPVSLRSIASSPASHVASPAPLQPKHVEEGELELDGGSEEDADVEELELPSPVREGTGQDAGGGDDGLEEEEDDLDAQLAAAMAEEDDGSLLPPVGVAEEEEESEEE